MKVGCLAGKLHQALRLSVPIAEAWQTEVQLLVVHLALALGHESNQIKLVLQLVGVKYPNALSKRFLASLVTKAGALVRATRLVDIGARLSNV